MCSAAVTGRSLFMPRFPGVSTPGNKHSPLCGGMTRHYAFITADFPILTVRRSADTGLRRLAGSINCFWLIKAPNFHPIVCKPGAMRPAQHCYHGCGYGSLTAVGVTVPSVCVQVAGEQ